MGKEVAGRNLDREEIFMTFKDLLGEVRTILIPKSGPPVKETAAGEALTHISPSGRVRAADSPQADLKKRPYISQRRTEPGEFGSKKPASKFPETGTA